MALDKKQRVELGGTLRMMVWAIDMANRNQLTPAEIATTRDMVNRLIRSLED